MVKLGGSYRHVLSVARILSFWDRGLDFHGSQANMFRQHQAPIKCLHYVHKNGHQHPRRLRHLKRKSKAKKKKKKIRNIKRITTSPNHTHHQSDPSKASPVFLDQRQILKTQSYSRCRMCTIAVIEHRCVDCNALLWYKTREIFRCRVPQNCTTENCRAHVVEINGGVYICRRCGINRYRRQLVQRFREDRRMPAHWD